MKNLNENQAFKAMVYFWEGIYQRTLSNEIGGILGGLMISQDGNPMDLAVINDWKIAIEKALHEK